MDNSGYAVEIENREYVDPNVSLGEGQQFIENLRQVQAENNQQIKQDTYNLGTPTTANLGGLTGAEATWNARYQTPQMNQLVSNLDTNMRQTALNTAMQNILDVYKQRANEAQRALQRAQNRYSTRKRYSSGGGGDGSYSNYSGGGQQAQQEQQGDDGSYTPEGVSDVKTSDMTFVGSTIRAAPGESTIASPWKGDDGNPINYVYNDKGELVRLDGVYNKGSEVYKRLKKAYPNLVD